MVKKIEKTFVPRESLKEVSGGAVPVKKPHPPIRKPKVR